MKKFFLAMTAAVAVLVATAAPADAVFRMRVEDTGAGVGAVITDGGAGDLSPGVNDVILFSGTVGAFMISIQVGTATPGAPMAGYYDAIDLNNVSISTAGGGGTLRIILEKDSFSNAPDGPIVLESAIGGVNSSPAGSTVSFRGWGNDGNLIPALGADQAPGAIAPIVFPPPPAGSVATPVQTVGTGAFSGTVTVPFTKTGTYSLFSQAVITLTGPGTVTFDQTTGCTPAPAGLLLLGAALPCLGLGYLRRRKAIKA